MPETPVQSDVCSVCGAATGPNTDTAVCSACTAALGSVMIVQPSTVTGAPEAFSRGPVALGRFGDYEILSELARGGMGVVYSARQISLNRLVALKMILTPFVSAKQRQRFHAEAEHAATLDHPNIIPIYDSGAVNGLPYFTMKLVKGRPLSAELRRLILEPRKGVKILIDVARAVHFAHQRGIMHRDLKPANILIDEDGVAYVSDFGIAKRVDGPEMTHDGGIVGTPYYMPPEQAAGDQRLTTGADVYGLGAIFYEILTLRMPFFDAKKSEVFHKIKSEEPAPPRKLRPGVDRDLETICLKCLEKDPARRYASAESLARDLERWLNGIPIYARRHSRWERAAKWARRQPAVACSVALAVLLAGALAGAYWHSGALLRRAERQKLEERRRFAETAVADGVRALELAHRAGGEGRALDAENALIDAEDRFRAALVSQAGNAAAEEGLRETTLMSFDASLKAHSWRQAREKLLLAHNAAALPRAEFDRRQAELERLKSARWTEIRARVTQLMDDAASLARTVTPEMAVNELIAMKDPFTVKLMSYYTSHERPECRALACSVLAWIGDESVVPALLQCIQPRLPSHRENPVAVQEAALIAICRLAADDDLKTFDIVEKRINAETSDKSSLLYHRIEYHYRDFARRQAKHAVASGQAAPVDLYRRACQLSESGAHREAIAILDGLVSSHPHNAEYLNYRGIARWKMGDLQGAVKDLTVVIERAPRERMGYINRGGVLLDLQDFAGALKDLDKALTFTPDDSAIWATRGSARAGLGNLDGAMEDYDRALTLNPNELYALTNRGHARAQTGDFRGALPDLDRALALNPQFWRALTGRACTRMELRDFDGAIADFDRTLALNPMQANCFYNRAVLKANKQELSDALRDYDRAIALDPSKPIAYYNRACVKGKIGDDAGAAKDYVKTIEMVPNHVESMINLGLIRGHEGDTRAALELFNRALSINPNKREGLDSRAALHFKEGRAAEAAADMKKLLRTLANEREHPMRRQLQERLSEYESAAKRLAKE